MTDATSDPSAVVEASPDPAPPGTFGEGGGGGGGSGGGGGPGGGGGTPEATFAVTIDGSSVTDCAIRGSVTRRLNRPAQATVTLPMDCAIGGPGSRLALYIDGTLFFHGFVLDCETDAGEDFGYTVYNASDPMEMWAMRPARDGPDAADPGDFSNPSMFYEFGPSGGPAIIEQMLLQSEDDSDPEFGEGPLFLTLGSFATGGVDVSGGPTDWPMSILQVTSLLMSTGEVDVVITPTDPGGGVMGTVDVYNGDYGTDLSGSVSFDYGQGNYSIKRVRWNEDMSNVCNKLWYFGGPRILSAADPEGNQHWCWNITADDGALPDPPQTAIIAKRDASRTTYGVRMDIQIYDAVSENCVGKGGIDPNRWLYRRLWQIESWLRADPRELIHITPVAGTGILSFDIGDLISVSGVSTVRGGFSGAQRVYEYTYSWDENGPIQLDELQTSPNNEGF